MLGIIKVSSVLLSLALTGCGEIVNSQKQACIENHGKPVTIWFGTKVLCNSLEERKLF